MRPCFEQGITYPAGCTDKRDVGDMDADQLGDTRTGVVQNSEQDSIGLADLRLQMTGTYALFFLRPHGRALADSDLYFDNALVATQSKACSFVGFEGSNQVKHGLWILDRLASYGE